MRGSARGSSPGLFLVGYAVARMSGELFRQPDPQLGFLIFGTTMGQLLSIPVLIAGVLIIAWALRAPVPAPIVSERRSPTRSSGASAPRGR